MPSYAFFCKLYKITTMRTKNNNSKPKRKGYFTKRFKYYEDPIIRVIKVESDNRKDIYYAKHFTELLTLITKHITPLVNYAHFELLIPKFDLPLQFEKQHMDISYFTSDKCLIFIQFHVLKPECVPKYVYEALWR